MVHPNTPQTVAGGRFLALLLGKLRRGDLIRLRVSDVVGGVKFCLGRNTKQIG